MTTEQIVERLKQIETAEDSRLWSGNISTSHAEELCGLRLADLRRDIDAKDFATYLELTDLGELLLAGWKATR